MKEPNANYQYLGASIVSLLGFHYGIVCGWPSPAIFLLLSSKSPLSTGPITMEQASWITSLKSGGMVIGCIFVGILANKFGRKRSLVFLTIPSLLSWFLIYFAEHVSNVSSLIVARTIHGLVSAGIITFGQLYLVEVSNDRIRGALGSTLLSSSLFGIVATFAIGTYASYDAIPLFAIAINVLFAILFSFFAETPLFLLKNGKVMEARRSIRFYQNIDVKDVRLIDAEIERLMRQIGSVESSKKMIKWSELRKNPGKKAMIIGIVLGVLNHFSGNYALISYTATIFEASESIISPNESALIVSFIQCISAFLVPLFVERCGRKPLYVISTAGSAMGLSILGSYLMLKSWHYDVQSLSWIPIVSLSATIAIQSLAVSTLSFAITAEILPDHLRDFGTSFCNAVLSLSAFIVLKFMPFLNETVGLHGTMFLFAGFCLACTVFVISYVPETMGKKYEEIMESLR